MLSSPPYQQQAERWIHLFNNLGTGLNSGLYQSLAHPDIRFVDPFHDAQGQHIVQEILWRFASEVEDIHFQIQEIAWANPQRCYLHWQFSGKQQRLGLWQFAGITELEFDSQGLVVLHRDYWDAAEHCYMKVPLLGRVLRWLRERIAGRTER